MYQRVHCQQCGGVVDGGTNFCQECGHNTQQDVYTTPPPQGQPGFPQQGGGGLYPGHGTPHAPPPPQAPPSPYQLSQLAGKQFPPGNGPVPHHRRNGWLVWAAYLGIVILGTIFGTALFAAGINGGECYTEMGYYGEYTYCEPDEGLMLLSMLVNWGSTLAAMIIGIWWSYSMYSEFNTYAQREVLNPFLAVCIPIFNIYAFYLFCDELNKEATKRGRPGFIDPTMTCCLIFILGIGWPIYQGKLNEFWDLVAYQQQY